jgi:uncharacterized protein
MQNPMKTTLDHLPEPKQVRLGQITQVLVETVPDIDKVILFGSFARGDWVEDPIGGYFSDFDILVVVDKPAVANNASLWGPLTEKISAIAGTTAVSLICHDIRELNAQIRRGQYFFADIVAEGILLHDAGRFTVATPKASTPEERLKLAERDFKQWFTSAGGFWNGTGYFMNKGEESHAAFLLHQSVERYFHAVLLVHTGYKPKCHNIEKLAEMTASLHETLAGAMPRTAPEDHRLFDLLKRAYIDARYSPSYRITYDELTVLRGHVQDLATRVRAACKAYLETIVTPKAVSELPERPEEVDLTGLPEPPPVTDDDPEAMARWQRFIVEMGREAGRLEGREVGLREGEAKGRETGLREGREEERRAMAVKLLASGMDAAEVAALTELPKADILTMLDSVTLNGKI